MAKKLKKKKFLILLEQARFNASILTSVKQKFFEEDAQRSLF
jgi:hypothetical protein